MNPFTFMQSKCGVRFLGITAVLLWAGILPVLAQRGGSEQDAATLDTVVVTANKRVENIREIAAAISVIGETKLEALGINSLSGYADMIPGLQVQDSGNPGLTAVSIRGISALSAGATVATYIDEVPLGSSGLYQQAARMMLDLMPYDISRIEVLRGPQGTLYGAGAIGGLLKYVTRPPDLSRYEFRAGAGFTTVGDGGSAWRGRIGASIPLQQDRLGLRLSYAHNEIAGYINSSADGRRRLNQGEQTSARAALLWEGERATTNFGVLQQRIRSDSRARVALDPQSLKPLFGHLTDRTWQPSPFAKDVTLGSLSIDWDLGWGNLVSATGWSKTRTLNQEDTTIEFGEVGNLLLGMPEPGSSYELDDISLRKWTQELRLASNSGGRFEWMLSSFYTKETAQQTQFVWLGNLDGSPLLPPLDAMSTLAFLALPSSYREIAVFANGSWRVSPRVKLDVGVRYARNDQRFSQNVSEGILVALGNVPGGSRENVSTWSLSPQFTINKDVMLYARAATGYQPGGPNVSLPGLPRQVDSSMLTSYELGMKSQFAERRVQLDVSMFRIIWDDIQLRTIISNGANGMINGGEATSDGVELSSLFRVSDGLSIGLNAAYTKARLKDDFNPVVLELNSQDVILNSGLAHDRMPYSPRLSWSANADYTFMLPNEFNVQLGLAVRWMGERLNRTTERQRITAPGDPSAIIDEIVTPPLPLKRYHALDLYASLGKRAREWRVYVNNLSNTRNWSSMTLISGAVSGTAAQVAAVPIQPRTFGMELDYRF